MSVETAMIVHAARDRRVCEELVRLWQCATFTARWTAATIYYNSVKSYGIRAITARQRERSGLP